MKKLFCKNECKDNGKCGIFKIVAIAGTVIAVLVGFVVLICKKFSSKKNEEDTEEFDDFDDFDDDFELDVDETEESEDDASSDKEETEETEESEEDDDDTSDDNVYIKDVEYSDEETEKQDEE